MQIIFWGCRGSIPVPGKDTLRYGGNTTCVEVRLGDGTVIILDAGTGIRNLGKDLLKRNDLHELYLFFTHPHWDHIAGFPFFAPAYSDKYLIHIRGGPIAKETIKGYLEHQMQQPFFPVRLQSMKARFDFTSGVPIVRNIGTSVVTPITLSHPIGYGFKISEGDTSLVFLPDNELDFKHENGAALYQYINFCRDADLLIHDTQYTDEEYRKAEGWGHSRYSSVVNLAVKAKVKRLCIFHHNPDHSDDDVDMIYSACSKLITVQKSTLQCFAPQEGSEISI